MSGGVGDAGVSILERLSARAGAAPGGEVGEAGGRRISTGALVARARQVSAALSRRGMRPGDRALFSIRPSIAALEAILAIDDAGGAIVPVDPRMGHELFAARLPLLEPRWVFAESLLYAASAPWLAPLLRRRGVALAALGRVPGTTRVRAGRWLPGATGTLSLDRLAHEPLEGDAGGGARRPVPDEETASFIVFTSGTTGAPKAVVHTRRSLRAILRSIEDEIALGADDVLHARDLHLILPALVAGAKVVIPRPSAFDPARTLDELERFGVTRLFVVTGDCRALVERCEASGRRLPATLREVLIGGAPAHAPFLARLHDVLAPGTRAWCIYGMTEILPVARVSLDDKLAYAGEGDYVGTLVPGVRGRIADDGELLLSGEGLFAGYLGGAPVREHATGDLARLVGGELALLGRKKDMIIRGDFNLYPELYEPTVERIPGVRRAVFVGVYDERGADERVVLVVEPDGAGDVTTLPARVARALRAGDTRIDEPALPDHILVMPLPEGGRSSKVDKRALRDLVAASLLARR